MHRRSLLLLALSSAAVWAAGPAAAAATGEGYRLSGPHTHANLAIYFVHGKSVGGPVPLTLQEAMTSNAVQVYETSNVNELTIENVSDREVFVQSGDIVKGGKQDRVLMVSLVLPPRSGKMPIASFCVEQGRWSPRGREDAARFSSANAALPSRHAKVAMKAPIRAAAPTETPERAMGPAADVDSFNPRGQGTAGRVIDRIVRGPSTSHARRSETGERQREVWNSVASTQQKLAGGIGHSVNSGVSQSSLQLSLENEKLKETQAAFVKALRAEGEKGDDIIGFVFAINGKLNSADVYPSNGLFRKMWEKLLNASITEAIGEGNSQAAANPSVEEVLAFLSAAEGGEAQQRELIKTVRLETREADKVLYFATERTGGGFVHRNYLAK
jgi:hypothetical protein